MGGAGAWWWRVVSAGLGGGLAMGAGGCANVFLEGSEVVAAPPGQPKATWTVSACRDAAGAAMKLPKALTYYLEVDAEEGPALYEFGAKADDAEDEPEGTKILNHWTGAKGEHFFTHVETSHGYEFILPKEAGAKGMRKVYLKGTFEAKENDDDIIKPVGVAAAACPMIPK